MVLSPIEPVAPRTVTALTPDVRTLLLGNGKALIFPPNHKTAADAIRASPQKPENRHQDDGGHESIEAVQQTAMPGNDVAGILDAEAPFDRGFEEIAELRRNREHRSQQQ